MLQVSEMESKEFSQAHALYLSLSRLVSAEAIAIRFSSGVEVDCQQSRQWACRWVTRAD